MCATATNFTWSGTEAKFRKESNKNAILAEKSRYYSKEWTNEPIKIENNAEFEIIYQKLSVLFEQFLNTFPTSQEQLNSQRIEAEKLAVIIENNYNSQVNQGLTIKNIHNHLILEVWLMEVIELLNFIQILMKELKNTGSSDKNGFLFETKNKICKRAVEIEIWLLKHIAMSEEEIFLNEIIPALSLSETPIPNKEWLDLYEKGKSHLKIKLEDLKSQLKIDELLSKQLEQLSRFFKEFERDLNYDSFCSNFGSILLRQQVFLGFCLQPRSAQKEALLSDAIIIENIKFHQNQKASLGHQ